MCFVAEPIVTREFRGKIDGQHLTLADLKFLKTLSLDNTRVITIKIV